MTTPAAILCRLLRHGRIGACIALCAALFTQPAWAAPPGPDGNRGHLNRVLHNSTVINHLGLSESQAEAAQATSNTVVENHRAEFDAAAAYATRDARVAHVARLFVTITEQTFAQLKDVLSPAQHQRLQQIELQTFALRAFARPSVVSALGLTDAQQRTLNTIAAEAGQQTQAVVQSQTLSAAEKARQNQKIRESALQNVRQQLNAGQWVKWELLTGARFGL